jgi:hypothetical protein
MELVPTLFRCLGLLLLFVVCLITDPYRRLSVNLSTDYEQSVSSCSDLERGYGKMPLSYTISTALEIAETKAASLISRL